MQTTTRFGWLRLARCLSFLLLMGGLAYPGVAQIQTHEPDCANPPTYAYTLGAPGPTPYDIDATGGGTYPFLSNNGGGSYTFLPGNYHLEGNVRLMHGTFIIKPGTNFYVDGVWARVQGGLATTGYALIIGDQAFLQADGALFTAACNVNVQPFNPAMWEGIQFELYGSGQKLHLGNCIVAYAHYGVSVPPDVSGTNSNYTKYEIQDTRFEQNLFGIFDNGLHQGTPCSISHVTIISEPDLLFPYDGYHSWTREALHLTPTGKIDGIPEVIIDGVDRVKGGKSPNTITGASYGLVANKPGQAEIRIDDELIISRTLRIGIWLDELAPIVGLGVQTTVDMKSYPPIYTQSYSAYNLMAGQRAYGIVAAAVNSPVSASLIKIEGLSGSDTTTYRVQTGAFLNQISSPVKNMILNDLTLGMNLREGSQSIKGNAFTNCWHGAYIRPNAGYTVNFNIGCNTFGASTASTSSAILADQNAQLNQQGSIGNPMGNRFSGYAGGQNSVMNRNPGYFLNYYRYQGSVDEQATAVTNGANPSPLTTGFVNGTSSPYSLSSFCSASQGVNEGAHARGTSPASYLKALMDTLRRQVAPVTRLNAYQATIRQALLVAQPDTAALENYLGTLATTNAEAFYGLGLDLLEQYRRTGRAAAVVRLRPLLAARIAAYPAAADRLAISDVLSRLAPLVPGATRTVPAADSLTLARIARTTGGEAEIAAMWFTYLFPDTDLHANAPRPATAATAPVLRPAVVRSLYPNPAADRLHLELSAPAAARVELRLTELLSGRVALRTDVPATKADNRAAEVNVRALPSGQYAATLLVDGVPTATLKVLINR